VDQKDQVKASGNFDTTPGVDISETVTLADTKDLLNPNETYTINTTYEMLDGIEHDLVSKEFTTLESETPTAIINNIQANILDAQFDIVLDPASVTDERFRPKELK
jgi:hypothetical protein